MIGRLPIQGYGFSLVILAQAVGLIPVLTEHKTKKYMNDVCRCALNQNCPYCKYGCLMVMYSLFQH